ncbi:hypothetical protein [Saccharothrix sp. HUAS TT1]|uniref:hypothetical protein n=1 Tax=unclassified Saccharothrix TaxID=2593673 RepID=UPI00345BD5D4
MSHTEPTPAGDIDTTPVAAPPIGTGPATADDDMLVIDGDFDTRTDMHKVRRGSGGPKHIVVTGDFFAG